MKIGVRESLLGADATLEEKFERAAALGLDGLEMIPRDAPGMHGMMVFEESGRCELIRLCGKYGLLISSLSLAGWRQRNCLTTDMGAWQDGKQHLIEAMACANALDADGILLPHFGEMTPVLDDPRLEWDCRGLRECAAVAENPDLLLCVECTVDGATMKGVCEMADHPQVGVYFDLGNLKSAGFDPVGQMREVGDGVKMIHIKEAGAELLGEGDVDMAECVAAMHDIGYDGWLVFETAATADPLAALRHNLAELRKHV